MFENFALRKPQSKPLTTSLNPSVLLLQTYYIIRFYCSIFYVLYLILVLHISSDTLLPTEFFVGLHGPADREELAQLRVPRPASWFRFRV